MKLRLKLVFGLTLVCGLAACAGNTPPGAPAQTTNTPVAANTPAAPTEKPTPAQIVRAQADAVTVKAGASAEAQVRVRIEPGYHVNANPATFSYLHATELKVQPDAGLTPGKPAYPPAVQRTFQFEKRPLAVYEGEATIRLPLRAAANAPKGAHTLRAQVHVQACDEERCFPPTDIAADIPVTIN
ncbi:MAG TPA: protein-disulfide reductase DsbD N-terminal domain-containing protein [Pyrinomonadaceae bacterium]